MRVFGIDPGSERTGYGCVETDGRRHRLVTCGAIVAPARDSFPERLERIHRELSKILRACRPECVAVENLFHAANVRSALKLGHARGVAMLAAIQSGCELAEYTPAEVKRAVVGYGRAEKRQVQQMVKLLLGLAEPPSPHDAADALAVAICHVQAGGVKVRLRSIALGPGKPDPTSDVTKVRLKPDPRYKKAFVEADLQVGPAGRSRAPRSWRDYRPAALLRQR